MRVERLELKKYSAFNSHVNFEIALLENCFGRRFVGDHVEDFEGTELVLLGSYVPHCWQYYGAIDPTVPAQATHVHFYPDLLGSQWWERPEATHLRTLFDRASRGVLFKGPAISKVQQLLQQMVTERGPARVAQMHQLLDVLAQSTTARELSSSYLDKTMPPGETGQFARVLDYICDHFREEIELQEVAGLLSMSAEDFSRYFKCSTNRSLAEFIKEVRIGHAARLLLTGQRNVLDAALESGYENIFNFIKDFKEIRGLSPTDFLKQYLGDNGATA
jgi:AraC-like DNA-binding protein